MDTPLVINLFGGPGCGKSTTAAGLFYKLKIEGFKVELITEYAKDKVYDKSYDVLKDQLYLFSKQARRQIRLIDEVDIIITDSPLLLSLHYNQSGITSRKNVIDDFENLVHSVYCEFENINYFLNRTKEYIKFGRTQDEEEARQIDSEIKNTLLKYKYPFTTIDGDCLASNLIFKDISEYFN